MAKSNTKNRSNAAASSAKDAAGKAKIAIFTRNSAKVQAMLFVNVSDNARAPLFGGSIAGVKVSAFLRHPENNPPFLSFVDNAGDQVATANVRIREQDGVPVLKAVLGKPEEAKTEAWFNVSKNISDETLALMGADISRLHKKAVKEAATA